MVYLLIGKMISKIRLPGIYKKSKTPLQWISMKILGDMTRMENKRVLVGKSGSRRPVG